MAAGRPSLVPQAEERDSATGSGQETKPSPTATTAVFAAVWRARAGCRSGGRFGRGTIAFGATGIGIKNARAAESVFPTGTWRIPTGLIGGTAPIPAASGRTGIGDRNGPEVNDGTDRCKHIPISQMREGDGEAV